MGAVIVRDGDVVGRGFHTWAGVKHAEVLALEEAGAKRARRDACTSRSSRVRIRAARRPASDAIIAAGIAKVVAPMEDPNPQVRGRGFAQLARRGRRSRDRRRIRRARGASSTKRSSISCAPAGRW